LALELVVVAGEAWVESPRHIRDVRGPRGMKLSNACNLFV
jgi:hypothetical protein